ncbi:MAG: hypothetical protein BroJett025_00770 [Patescibacteria group bacterium]|nr:MAG: hypothetical protein BroJett025_00770 [Patescibacteria group bacterium]
MQKGPICHEEEAHLNRQVSIPRPTDFSEQIHKQEVTQARNLLNALESSEPFANIRAVIDRITAIKRNTMFKNTTVSHISESTLTTKNIGETLGYRNLNVRVHGYFIWFTRQDGAWHINFCATPNGN